MTRSPFDSKIPRLDFADSTNFLQGSRQAVVAQPLRLLMHTLTGVKGINDRIAVKPVVEPKEVEKDIMNALTRHAQLDATRITVEFHGDRAVLSGSVRTWAEREEAEEAVRAAPGVANIENNITIVA